MSSKEAKPKGLRTIDARYDGALFGGVGCFYYGHTRDELITIHGAVSASDVMAILQRLHFEPNTREMESLCFDLTSMRITEHRARSSLDIIAETAPTLPDVCQAALVELEAAMPVQAMSASALLAAHRDAIEKLKRAAEGVVRSQPWEMSRQDWHSDAFVIAAYIYRMGQSSSIETSFRSSDGPAVRAVADLLALTGMTVRGQTVKPDTVRNALKVHPLAWAIGLPSANLGV